jgi:mRNA interferase HigB
MRIIAQSTLNAFARKHPQTRVALARWTEITLEAEWANTSEVQMTFPKAKVLNGERVRFEISGGDYRLIAAFKFRSQICFIKFIGTHTEYDRIDALTVSQF